MEKKLITFEQITAFCDARVAGECHYNCMDKICKEVNCPIWQNLESPEEKIIITPAGEK